MHFERDRTLSGRLDGDQRERAITRPDVEETRASRQRAEELLPEPSDVSGVPVRRAGRARDDAPAPPEVFPLRKRRDHASGAR